MLGAGYKLQCETPPLYTRVELKQDTEPQMTLEPFLTQIKQVEAGLLVAKLYQQRVLKQRSVYNKVIL